MPGLQGPVDNPQCGHCHHSLYSHDTTGQCSYCMMLQRGSGIAKLPEITEAERLELKPGDILVVYNNAFEIDREQANEIENAVRRHLGRPDLKVMALGRDWGVTVIQDAWPDA